MNVLFIIVSVIAYVCLVDADVYLTNPRGTNNRLNESSATRKNNDRVFDSQNNARGGYNVGDLTHEPAGTNGGEQYQMKYIMSPLDPTKGGSVLSIEWTNQHGCGRNTDDDPNKLNCNIVIQMMCQTIGVGADAPGQKSGMRDGHKTDTNQYEVPSPDEDSYAKFEERRDKNVQMDRAVNEPFEWYDKCSTRSRNKGLFVADQDLAGEASNYTRQNPHGTRRGYECPEERDYYPYWHPTPWKDLIVLAERKERCAFYTEHSFNVKSKYECVEDWKVDKSGPQKHYSYHNNKFDCVEANGNWTEFHNYLEILEQEDVGSCGAKNQTTDFFGKLLWARPMLSRDPKCLVRLDAPTCDEAPYSRVNHLGNGVDLEALSAQWKIPAFPSGRTQKCVMRIRYNISTDDYNPETTSHVTEVEKTFAYTDEGSNIKAMFKYDGLPVSNGVGKMYPGQVGDEKFQPNEYYTWENIHGRQGGSQWLGWQTLEFSNRYLTISFWIKFVGQVPPKSKNFGMKVYGKVYDEFVGRCTPDTWCYVKMTVKCAERGDGEHVILIFDTINQKQKIHVALLTVEIIKIITPITQNPVVNIGAIGQGIQLAINTSQFGRTFQDRSHIFHLEKKDIFTNGETLYTISVRGKRGNIVQTFPAVEYDFYPTNLTMTENDMVYFTWTGSNTHKNGGPGGDGQTGDDGNGETGTDRSNVCGIGERDHNFVLPVDNRDNICQNIKRIVWSKYAIDTSDPVESKLDACIQLMSSGYYWCFRDHSSVCQRNSVDKKADMNDLLNNAPATFEGIILQFYSGIYHYMCSRNNDFSNRSHKGTINVLK